MITSVCGIAILCYISLLIELIFFPVPSVASTYQLVNNVNNTNNDSDQKGKIKSVKDWSSTKKTFLLILPAMVNIITFIIPLFVLLLTIFKSSFTIPIYQITGNHILMSLSLFTLLAGRFITIYSVYVIRKRNSQKGADFELKQNDIFAFSRNPGLIGMYIFIFGVFCLMPNKYFLVGFIFYVGYMHFKVLLEEDFLLQMFGEKYGTYKTQTRRYV